MTAMMTSISKTKQGAFSMFGIKPVSYTHLDVYKRQSQDSAGNYYASVLFEFEKEIIPVPVSDNVIGLDYASDGLYKDNYGNTGSDHKFFRESQKKLRREQMRLSRMTGSKKDEPKSNNYMKQQLKVNKIYRHAANQRLDHLHKLSTGIANRYDIVCVDVYKRQQQDRPCHRNKRADEYKLHGILPIRNLRGSRTRHEHRCKKAASYSVCG